MEVRPNIFRKSLSLNLRFPANFDFFISYERKINFDPNDQYEHSYNITIKDKHERTQNSELVNFLSKVLYTLGVTKCECVVVKQDVDLNLNYFLTEFKKIMTELNTTYDFIPRGEEVEVYIDNNLVYSFNRRVIL